MMIQGLLLPSLELPHDDASEGSTLYSSSRHMMIKGLLLLSLELPGDAWVALVVLGVTSKGYNSPYPLSVDNRQLIIISLKMENGDESKSSSPSLVLVSCWFEQDDGSSLMIRATLPSTIISLSDWPFCLVYRE